MPSQVTRKGPVKPSMNITPLIDVVFLLIIFFMLVNNIVAEETVALIVPTLDDPKTRDLGDVDRIVINIAPAPFDQSERMKGNPLLHDPQAQFLKVGIRTFEMTPEGIKAATDALKEQVDRRPKNADGSSTLEVLLRADAALAYSEVAPVMTMITGAGVGKVNLVAFMPEE